MLDAYLKKKEVSLFIQELRRNPKYLQKNVHQESHYGQYIGDELALYLFYDSLIKYKMIIDDDSLFDEYVSQVEKIYRKIEDYDDVVRGIHKLLVNLAASSLGIQDIESGEGKKKIIQHFYQKYILDGYFVHGFSTTYEEFMKGRNFIPEKYPNRYHKMFKVQQIIAHYKRFVMEKDFRVEQVDMTDDFIMGCHYSASSPGYFYQLLTNCGVEKSAYLKQDHHAAMSSLKRFMNNRSMKSSDQKNILKIVEEEWNFISRVPRKISLLLVKRNKVMEIPDRLNDYLSSDRDLYDIIDRILCPRYAAIPLQRPLKYGEYQMISLEDFYIASKEKEVVSLKDNKQVHSYELLNSYGIVSFCLILGSLLITLGVIISIIMVLRGM